MTDCRRAGLVARCRAARQRWRTAVRRAAGRWRFVRSDAGNAALELVVLAPVLLAVLGLVIAAGRTSIAEGAVQAAARDAARQASIALNPYAAEAAGQASARAALREDGLDCDPTVTIDTAGFGAQPGQPAAPVVATVTCTVPLANLYLPGLPGVRTMSAAFSSPLDVYRSK
jgi:Flp pilus assembly protein TadG